MKKILSTVAALGLVAGFAATASALDTPHEVGPATGYDRSADTPTAPGVDLFSVKGSYSLAGAIQSDGLGAGNGVQLRGLGTTGALGVNGDDAASSDDFYFHSFITNMVMNVGDKIAVKGQLRFADRDVWGQTGGFDAGTTIGTNLTATGGSSGRIIDTREIYMDYTSPIGLVRMGRVPVAAWYGNYINSGTSGDRIMYWPNFIPKPFSALVFVQKVTENDATNTGSDSDNDGYYAGVEHKMDMGTTALAYFHQRTGAGTFNPVTGANPETDESFSRQDIWAYGKYNVGMFTIEGELSYDFGETTAETRINTAATDPAPLVVQGKDADALAGMLDVTAKIGNLSVGALYFYASGDDNALDEDREDFLAINDGTGDDFNPYHILTGDWTGILNNDKAIGPQQANAFAAGVHSIGAHASYPVTPKLTLSGAIGYAMAAEDTLATSRTFLGAPDLLNQTFDDEYGIEYDVNLAYKLLDNLTYSAHFGFLDTGDFFAGPTTTRLANGAVISTPATDVNDITFVAHQISMNF